MMLQWCSGIGQFDLIIARFSILFGTLCLENGNQKFGSQALPIQITRLLTSDFGNWREKLWDKMKNIWKQENTPKGQRQQPWNSGSALQPKDWCPPKCFAKAKTFQIICTQKQEGKSYLGVFARNQEDYCHLVQATWLESLLHTRQIQSTRSNKSTEYNLLTSHDPHGMYKFHQIKDPLFQAMPSSVHIH
jgi:hypothetical protein